MSRTGVQTAWHRFVGDFETHPDAGIIAARLAQSFPEWVTRRVEQAVYLDDTTVRWRVSVTFRLPKPSFFEGAVSLSPGEKIYVPLMLLRKTPLTHFDVRAEDGRALPVLASKENSQISEAGMIGIVWSLAESMGRQGLRDDTVELIRAVVSAAPGRARPIIDSALQAGELADVLKEDNEYRALINELATSFMLLTPITYEPDRERVIKYAYTAPLPWKWTTRNIAAIFGWADMRADLDNLGLGSSDSYHVEVEAPSDVRLSKASVHGVYLDRERGESVSVRLDQDGDHPRVNLHAVRPNERRWELAKATVAYQELPSGERRRAPKPVAPAEPEDPVQRAHAERPTPVERDDEGFARVWFRNEIAGVFIAAVAISTLTCLALWGVRSRLVELDGQTAAAILLGLPILAAGYLIRLGEHAFSTRLLLGVRALTLLVGVCALLVAALLGAGVTTRPANAFPNYRCTAPSGRTSQLKPPTRSAGALNCVVVSTPKRLKPHVQALTNWSTGIATVAVAVLLVGLLRTWMWPCGARPESEP